MHKFPNLKKPSHLLATLFGVGKLPYGPGTWGSLATLIIWYFCDEAIQKNILFLLIVIIFSIVVCYIATKDIEEKDHKSIVIDEFAGMWLALFMIPDISAAGLTFLLFRMFDIFKPFPISYVDNNMKNGFGVVLDDLIAGLLAGLLTIVLYTFL
ncbi:MAG: phosphatidylglycerophosphatase A [SAR86 cluster bacterium]|jgi:phosphatidylglycerophosphatase A|nr:phosphatidylglycerophosphatase A [SAR86 cluster bacterium]